MVKLIWLKMKKEMKFLKTSIISILLEEQHTVMENNMNG